jgi:hypothetical protein
MRLRTERSDARTGRDGWFRRTVVIGVVALGAALSTAALIIDRPADSSSPSATSQTPDPSFVDLTNPAHEPNRRDTTGIQGKESAMRQETDHRYIGLWVTADNHVRQRLLPNGRYVEARGNIERAYTGRYEVSGDYIEYWDDTGFTADGNFRHDILYHGGMVMRRAE